MNLADAAIFMSDRLGAERALREDEVDVLMVIIGHTGLKRGRSWTRDEDETVRLAMRRDPRGYANNVAIELNRTVWSVRNRARKLKERGRG